MKKLLFIIVFISYFTVSQAQRAPEINKMEFSEEALAQTIQDFDATVFTIGEVFKKHQGKVILLDIWASWCPDCITGLPELKQLQKQYPQVVYLFFSLDRIGNETAWKNAITKFDIQGEHYWFNSEWKNDFNNYIELNWIPRYLLIDKDGKIAHYYAIKANDPVLLESLKTLVVE